MVPGLQEINILISIIAYKYKNILYYILCYCRYANGTNKIKSGNDLSIQFKLKFKVVLKNYNFV